MSQALRPTEKLVRVECILCHMDDDIVVEVPMNFDVISDRYRLDWCPWCKKDDIDPVTGAARIIIQLLD